MADAGTPAFRLFWSAVTGAREALGLVETPGADGGPYLPLTSHAPFHQGRCGEARLYTSPQTPGFHRAITVSIGAPAIGLDSHMMFAFTRTGAAVPHFTVDSVQNGDQLAFHLDLIPRLDLATHLAYMDWAFGGLTETFNAAANIEGLSPAQITPRQRAVMSPWMLVHRATASAFAQIEPLVRTYEDHWLKLLREGAPAGVLEGADATVLAQRDRRNRAIIFDPDVDRVWNQITGLIGADAVLAIRSLLLDTGA